MNQNPQSENREIPSASLLSIGDELLLGEIVDTNMPYIAQALLSLGITVAGSETVGDELAGIAAAFQRAMARSPIVLATGGLGPTGDDLTMEALAQALGLGLEFREEVMEQMAARLQRPVSALSSSNRKQAFLPAGAVVLRNDWGTAPGVPREMKGLLGERIQPWLRANFSAAQAIAIKRFHAFGIAESVVGERIQPLMQAGHNPNVGTRVGGGIVSVRLVASAPDEAQAREILAPASEKVRLALSEGLFGEDDESLASAALKALLARGKTLALAESCTGGLIAALLTEVPGASAALVEGAVVYSNQAKQRCCGVQAETLEAHGAVSAETAAELALGIRARAGVDIGLGVTGVAGPGGGTEEKPVGLVYFGIATASGVQTLECKYPGLDRNMLRERAAAQGLDLIRRAALE